MVSVSAVMIVVGAVMILLVVVGAVVIVFCIVGDLFFVKGIRQILKVSGRKLSERYDFLGYHLM